jgi:hypothetical protein
MRGNYFKYTLVLSSFFLAMTGCVKDKDYEVPTPKNEMQNDCIKRTLGPNLVGQDIEFAYAMALPAAKGKLVSAQVEATIAGAPETYLENNSYYTNSSGIDVGVPVGSPSVNKETTTTVTFTKDTNAVTLRYFYRIPEEARGKSVKFTFSAKASDGETVSYSMGPYDVAKMNMTLDLTATDGDKCYISIADMAVYNAQDAAANAGKIDLVYLYRAIPNITFKHALVSPAADPEYLPGVTLPASVNNSTKVEKVWGLRDFNLARLQYGIYIDDVDFEKLDLSTAPNYAVNLKTEAGVWAETADGKYRAYIFVNKADDTNKRATISIKRYTMK